jgi:antitoxin (DNA-binding transcriptional repressor) of toxin-antitoxin stability system
MYSIMETQHHLSRVLREVEAGREVGITRRKKVVAYVRPAAEGAAVSFPDFTERARAIWGKGWRGWSAEELVRESRGPR